MFARLLRVLKENFSAAVPDRSIVRMVNSRNDLNQRGFAGTVIASQRQDFAWVKLERDIFQSMDAAETLGHTLDFQDRCLTHRASLHLVVSASDLLGQR